MLNVKPVITLQDLAINICIEAKESGVKFSSEFLKKNNILPLDWELSRLPITTNELTQLIFTNGVRIVIDRHNSITFIEPLVSKNSQKIRIIEISKKFIRAFDYINYYTVNFHIKTFVRFEGNDISPQELVRQYILSLLSSDLFSSNFKQSPASATINLVYDFEKITLNLNIQEINIYLPNNQVSPNVLFLGSISHKIAENDRLASWQHTLHFIDSWDRNFDIYIEILNKLLKQNPS